LLTVELEIHGGRRRPRRAPAHARSEPKLFHGTLVSW
jgi:hypothetical protein